MQSKPTAIRELRYNRAPCENGNLVKIYKACFSSFGLWLHLIISRVCPSEIVPSNWSEALLPLLKKRDKQIRYNCRGINLIDVATNIFGVILIKIFQGPVYPSQPKWPLAWMRMHSPNAQSASIGFLVKPWKINQGFRLVQMSMYMTSIMRTILCFWATSTGRYKARLK